jgi:PEGA domain-containing protein
VPSPIFKQTVRAIGARGVCLVLALAALTAMPARAIGATAEEMGRARAKLHEGASALDDGDYEAALARFQEAFQIVPSPKIQFDFGLAYAGLARHADAFERFLAEAKDAPAANRAEAERHVAELRRRVGTVVITCDTAGAEVKLDGRTLGKTPLAKKVYVGLGAHEIVVRAGARAPFLEDFTAAAGVEHRVVANLAAAPAAGRTASLTAAPPGPNGENMPLLASQPEPARGDETEHAGHAWLYWTAAGVVVAGLAVAAVVVFGRTTSYPSVAGTVQGN